MITLTAKEKRKLLYAAKSLFNTKSLVFPKAISDIPNNHSFARELRLKGNRIGYLTDSGYEHFRTVVNILDRADFFDGMAGYSDVWSAWHNVVVKWLSIGCMPEHPDEVVQAIADLVAEEIDDHTFLVPLFGIELDGVDSFAFDAMTILRRPVEVLDAAGVVHDHADIPQLLKLNERHLWLKGSTRGTARVAKQKFSEQATLTSGMLAITAASIYEMGASGFRIGIAMTPEEAIGRSVWFSWQERDRSVTTHFGSPKGQPFPVNKALGAESDMVRLLYRAFASLHASNRTPLEEAIARAVYWYSDAHRDPVLVMKLVKYWSCVEVFFSFEKEETTHAVSTGLASILVFSGFQFVPQSDYGKLKKQIVDLYELRSQAVHGGFHQHTTELDVAQFSQWVAWMIVSMVALVERGYTTLNEVKADTDRLDGIVKRTGKK
jgi:Apea-like HEPN